MRLFAGRYRASEKPFVAHLVGTASVVASLRARPAVILAALLHAAYVQGDFGDGPPGDSAPHVFCMREAIGDEAESLVAQYTRFPWGPEDLARLSERAVTMTDREKDLVLLRLANEVDDLADLGLLYYADAEHRRSEALAAAPMWITLAQRLASPELASALAAGTDELRSARVPLALQTEVSKSFDSRTPPQRTLWRRALERLRRRRRAAGAVRM
jgi:(p)ppGpp synthase/HD superfamily hydrolase